MDLGPSLGQWSHVPIGRHSLQRGAGRHARVYPGMTRVGTA